MTNAHFPFQVALSAEERTDSLSVLNANKNVMKKVLQF